MFKSLFKSEQEQPSFSERLGNIKSIFTQAHYDASKLHAEIDEDIRVKESIIKDIQEDITELKETKNFVGSFMVKVGNII